MDYSIVLPLISGLAWTVVYIECVRLGFRDKTYAMPFWALSLNLAWEGIFTVLGYQEVGMSLPVIVNATWLFLDLIVVYTFFKFGYKEFPGDLSKNAFYAWGLFGITVSFVLLLQFVREFGLIMGGSYAAFLQNMIMSILFLHMLAHRGNSKGQSLLIAILKMVGTLAATVLYGIIGKEELGGPNSLILLCGVLIFIFDSIYFVFLKSQIQKNKSPVANQPK
ncbi:MAG: hypothetical protein HKN16_03925 [Saprospiraceae bacterium]|nr:hypothetical protein [Saprospiraceae bacterium]